MKENWERTGYDLTLRPEEISLLIESAFPGQQVKSYLRMSKGLSNMNFKVVLGDGSPFLLRVYRNREGIMEKEASITRLVGDTVPVAHFIRTGYDDVANGHPWAVLEWKEGKLLADVMKSGVAMGLSDSAISAGNVLARIHRFTFPFHGLLDGNLTIRDPLTLNGDLFQRFMRNFLEGKCGETLGPALKEQVWHYCRSNSYLMTENREDPCLVHSDYNGLNILVNGGNSGKRVSAVLDWEFAASLSRYSDIGNMLRYEAEGSEFEISFLQGYASGGGVLDENWRQLSRLHDLIALCDLLNRSSERTPERVRDLTGLIGKTVLPFHLE